MDRISGPATDAQQRVTELVQAKKTQIVHESVADLGRWQTQLRALANHLEDLEHRAAVVGPAGAGPPRYADHILMLSGIT